MKRINFRIKYSNPYFRSFICGYELSIDDKRNFKKFVLISGQMVTVGNGIVEIDTSFSAKFIVTGLLCQ